MPCTVDAPAHDGDGVLGDLELGRAAGAGGERGSKQGDDVGCA